MGYVLYLCNYYVCYYYVLVGIMQFSLNTGEAMQGAAIDQPMQGAASVPKTEEEKLIVMQQCKATLEQIAESGKQTADSTAYSAVKDGFRVQC
jgi:hypothetical protein